jgi:SAM-dependent methyltransferase
MKDQPSTLTASSAWETLAQVYAGSRQVSADKLIEWPAQRALAGDFRGKRVLDVGCGTGDKARCFAEEGASSVIGVDASSGFAENWAEHANCSNLELVQGSFDALTSLPNVKGKAFDLIVSFQALMYARDLVSTLKVIANLLADDGALVFSVPHPFRFAILRNEIEGWGHGFAYQQTEPYRYPSPWKAEVYLEHPMPRISDYLNAIASAGLRLTTCEEPCVTQKFREIAPEKAEWMDRYVGIILFRANKNGCRGTRG